MKDSLIKQTLIWRTLAPIYVFSVFCAVGGSGSGFFKTFAGAKVLLFFEICKKNVIFLKKTEKLSRMEFLEMDEGGSSRIEFLEMDEGGSSGIQSLEMDEGGSSRIQSLEMDEGGSSRIQSLEMGPSGQVG